jgi:hypothetical protein
MVLSILLKVEVKYTSWKIRWHLVHTKFIIVQPLPLYSSKTFLSPENKTYIK